MIKEFNYLPNEDEQKFMQFMQSPDVPWYFQPCVKKDVMHFGHSLMNRNKENNPVEGTVNSPSYEYAKQFFLKICKENNIQVDVILRAAINNCFHYPDMHTGIHEDHPFEHYNFIYHVTDTEAPTYFFDKNDILIGQSAPEKNKVIIFDGQRHAQGNPKPGENRIVLLFTFIGKVE